MVDLLCAACCLLPEARARSLDISTLGGWISWNNLLNRPVFSCLGRSFSHLADVTEVVGKVHLEVPSDLLLNISLLAFWQADRQALVEHLAHVGCEQFFGLDHGSLHCTLTMFGVLLVPLVFSCQAGCRTRGPRPRD